MTLPEAAGLLLSFVARLITGAQGHWYGSVPKAEQEKRVQDEIPKDDDELFGDRKGGKAPEQRPERSG